MLLRADVSMVRRSSSVRRWRKATDDLAGFAQDFWRRFNDECPHLRLRCPYWRVGGLSESMGLHTSRPAPRTDDRPPTTGEPPPESTISPEAHDATKDHYRGQIVDTLIRCVIVDDNRYFLRVLKGVLEYNGIAVAGVASTSAEAVRHVRRHRPDVVLVDVGLGPDSGFDLARRLVTMTPAWQPSVILMSADSEDDLRPMLATSPAAAFLPKADISGRAVRAIHHRHRELCDGRPLGGTRAAGAVPEAAPAPAERRRHSPAARNPRCPRARRDRGDDRR